MPSLFTEKNLITLGSALVADTTAETKSAVEDMTGLDEITFLVALGDVDPAAILTFTVKENTANSTTSPSPTTVSVVSGTVTGAVTAVVTTGAVVLTELSGNLDNKVVAINVKKNAISKQYVFLSITATLESYEVNTIITIKSSPRSEPVTQGADVVSLTKYAA